MLPDRIAKPLSDMGQQEVSNWLFADHLEHGAERAAEVADDWYGYDRDSLGECCD